MSKQIEYLNNGGRRCPNCGSSNLYRNEDNTYGDYDQTVRVKEDKAIGITQCCDCRSEWKDVYQLIKFDEFEINKPGLALAALGEIYEINAINTGEIYTIILLRPDYFAEEYGKDTYTACVEATTPEEAIEMAKIECAAQDRRDTAAGFEESEYTEYLDDLHVLYIIKGKAEFISKET